MCLARVLVSKREYNSAKKCIIDCSKQYFSVDRETDFITFLLLESVEKIVGNLSDEMSDILDELYRFNDYEFFISHNNNSQIIPIPKI